LGFDGFRVDPNEFTLEFKDDRSRQHLDELVLGEKEKANHPYRARCFLAK
jgi:hypothetical protein